MAYGLTQSPSFDGSTQWAQKTSPSGLVSGNSARTLEGWFYIHTAPGGSNVTYYIINQGDNTGSVDGEFSLSVRFLTGSNTYVAIQDYYGNEDAGTVDWALSANTWYHAAMVYNGSGTMTYYKNGTLIDTVSCTRTPNTGTGIVGTGARVNNAGNPKSPIRTSLLRQWSSQRTGSEIANNMCNVYGTATTNMTAEWSLDNVLTDASGNGNTLSNTGSFSFSANVPSVCSIVRRQLLMGVGV